MSSLFRALGDETRLQLVVLLSGGELCVCHLVMVLGLSQPMVSRHLAILKNAGLIQSRRQGNWMYYRLAPQNDRHQQKVLNSLQRRFRANKVLTQEVSRVVQKVGPACR